MSVLKRRFPRHLQEFIFSMWKWNVNNESYISNVLYECIMRELVNANGIRLKNKMRFCFFFFPLLQRFWKEQGGFVDDTHFFVSWSQQTQR